MGGPTGGGRRHAASRAWAGRSSRANDGNTPASALAVPFSTLLSDDAPKSATVLRAASAKVLMSSDGAFASRELSPADGARPVEFYELHLAPRSAEHCAAHPVGTKANLVIASGSLSILVSGERYDLEARDAIFFSADCPHELRNESDEEARDHNAPGNQTMANGSDA